MYLCMHLCMCAYIYARSFEMERITAFILPGQITTVATTSSLVITSDCQSWCASHGTQWDKKCKWAACGACAQCASKFVGGRSSYMYVSMYVCAHIYERLFEMERITAFILPGQITTVATTSSLVITSDCQSWCASHETQWDKKCEFGACRACAQCASKFVRGRGACMYACSAWYACMYVSVLVCMYVCMYVSVHACMYVSVHVCICAC